MRALITGGSSGMGLEYARQLAERGCDLIIVSNRSDQLEEAAAELCTIVPSTGKPVDVVTHFQDLSLDDAADSLHDWCITQGLQVDILINNAGMFFWKELEPSDEARVDAMMKLHMMTPTRLCILFGADMKARGEGYILVVSSMTARLPVPGITIYSATKAYLKSFGRSMYYELRPYGVGMTTVCPAAIATPLYHLKESLMNLGVKFGVIKTPKWLVRRALSGMFRRRRSLSPAFMNVWLPPMVAALPRFAVDRIWAKFK